MVSGINVIKPQLGMRIIMAMCVKRISYYGCWPPVHIL